MTPLKKYFWLVDTIMRAGDKWLTLDQIGARWNAGDERDGQLVFSLLVRPSFDLKQKLLSMDSSAEVLKPESLRKEMPEEINAMRARYQKSGQ